MHKNNAMFLAKKETKGTTAFEFRNKLINLANTNRALIGNDQMINKHLSYYRNFISEENAKQDFDKDPFKDAFDMKCKNFSHFIQFLPTKLEVHLWNRGT